MKAIMVMYDTLCRRFLEPYGCDWVKTPNFNRLAEKSVTFKNSYVGSMPCMPARREIHTGRYNFLHREWGPIEPFDDSMPEILKKNGIYTHLVSDHYHYWEDGGCTYHTRYSTWDASRGQEGDPWKAMVAEPEMPDPVIQRKLGPLWRNDWVNRHFIREESQLPQAKTFAGGLEFLKTNHKDDDWFLHIETFDPHEPFFTVEKYLEMYPHQYRGAFFDWPQGCIRDEGRETTEHLRCLFAAMTSMCDHYLGKVLDAMDEYDLWKDTMLIVNTDHGWLLGEDDYWGKGPVPWYNESANTPLFIWDPRQGVAGEFREALVQTIDLPATLLDFFGVELPPDMQGVPLGDTIRDDRPVRDAALFGNFAAQVNVTDGRYVYMRAGGRDAEIHNYTHMPTHMSSMFTVDEMRTATMAPPFEFTKGCPLMKIRSKPYDAEHIYDTELYDLENDPEQMNPIDDPEVERMMIDHMVRLMKWNDSPPEQFTRLGLD